MFSRFFIPITPFLYILIEVLIHRISENSGKIRTGLSIFVISATLFYYNPYKGKNIPIIEGISNESEIYKREFIENLTKRLLGWRDIFVKNKIRIAFGGSQAIFAYYLESPLAIEAETGLTDYFIAHQTLGERGRIGHEKRASMSYLQERKIHLHLNPPDDLIRDGFNLFRVKDFPGVWKIITYDEDVMRNLLKNGDFSLK